MILILEEQDIFTTDIKHEPLTRGIVNKGFSGFWGVVTRFKICCNLTGEKPAIPN